ncbi:hypothetical protein [Inhella proteolytica]|uniref:Solute-binding protein family 3/N-terminal domain-containing protein n=1 Tax=Inhella proteolytica TaxID=2795029 RepID=A0A931J9G3_9BURK|nr:hypothetical protein [Inhella proteolytica]MBH9579237.1 hypothetical protein [Inhella proteolytica]
MRWLALTLLCLAPALTLAADCPQPLRIGFIDDDASPYIRGRGSEFQAEPGSTVRLTRQALELLGCPAELVRRPVRRLVAETLHDELQVAMLMRADSPDRAALGFPRRADGSVDPRLALGESRVVLFVRRPPPGQALPVANPARLSLGVIAGSPVEAAARRAGWHYQTATSRSSALAMLRGGRFEALVDVEGAIAPEELQREPALRVLQPPLQRAFFHAALSPALLQAQPQFAQRFWAALCKLSRPSQPGLGPCPQSL